MASKYAKGTWVEHPTANWGKGVVLEDSDGPTVCISFEKEGIKTIVLKYVEPRIISASLATDEQVGQLAARSRLYIDESFLDIYSDLKSKFPLHLVIIQNGYFFEILEDDAEYFRDLYGWKIHSRGDASITGFPVEAVSVWNKLRALKQPFVVISQLPTKKTGKIERRISDLFNGVTDVMFEAESSTAIVPQRAHTKGYGEDTYFPLSQLESSDYSKVMQFDSEKSRTLLREFGAPIEKPPGYIWEFGGDSWMKLVGNEFDRKRKKNARFELSAMIRSYLNELRDATDDAEALKTLTQTKNSISESEQLLVAVTIILRSCALTDVIRELRRALAGYRSQ